MSSSSRTPRPDIKNLLSIFHNNGFVQGRDKKNLEFEVRFGTRGFKKITKIDFDNAAQYLLSKGFRVDRRDQSSLRINNQFNDPKTGRVRISNIRTEIYGEHNISEYCKNNSIMEPGKDTARYGVKFLQKLNINDETGSFVRPLNFDDLNFRVSLQEERDLKESHGLVKQLINDWDNKKKIFRYVTRTTLYHPDYRFIRADLSVVRTSSIKENGNMIPTFSVLESNVFKNQEHYELELEVLPTMGRSLDEVNMRLRTVIKYMLCGLQQSSFPIGFDEIKRVKYDYMRLVHKKEHEKGVYPKHFIGPASITLELKHIQPLNEDSNEANIREDYCVTDKADGLRKMLYINQSGKIYLIDTNMNIQFTGLMTTSEEHFESLLDGEHVLHDKDGNYKNAYLVFDIYFIHGEDQRAKPFVDLDQYLMDEEAFQPANYRYHLIQPFLESLDAQEVASGNGKMIISSKIFKFPFSIPEGKKGDKWHSSIFECCNEILTRIQSGLVEYNTDGLIFTPCSLGAGMNPGDTEPRNSKYTWQRSFKWKPPEHNTVDFLVTTQKDESGKDIIHNIFQDGVDTKTSEQLVQYKTLVLRVGFDERKHGYINPCELVIQHKLPNVSDIDNEDSYKPVPFYPSNPTDKRASVCNVQLETSFGNKYMKIEDGSETFDDNTIVEFRYDTTREEGWRWIPIKVRYDKTAEFRNGLKNYGNAHHVAQSVWSSIHHPITREMLQAGINIPPVMEDDDVYYNRSSESNTGALRDFHNLYVKNKLITSVAQRGNTLVDLAVGKGGDFSKWIDAKLRFVFGIDVSRDNIENRVDGACARYLNYLRRYQRMPSALFVQGNSGLHIANGDALFTETGKQITNAVLGKGPRDETKLGRGVYKHYGMGKDGFDIVSTQFAIHYFFENPEVLHTYLQNVSEMCKVGGYFIGTSYDGRSLFNELRDVEEGKSVTEYKNGQKIWELTKAYSIEEFNNDVTSVGLAVDVYQDTINKVFREYLVNYDYLSELLQHYGFEMLSHEEASRMKMSSGLGMFSELYTSMMNDIKKSKRTKHFGRTREEMEYGRAQQLEDEAGQRRVSFLNKFFIFKKTHEVNAEQVRKTFLGIQTVEKEVVEEEMSQVAQKAVQEAQDAEPQPETAKPKKKRVIKKRKPMKLVMKE